MGSGVWMQVGKQVEGQGSLRYGGWGKFQQRASCRVGGGGVGFFREMPEKCLPHQG